jgi:hypothetical protein
MGTRTQQPARSWLDNPNPVNGQTLRRSRWQELPGEVADMLIDMHGVTPGMWDREVARTVTA